MHLTIIAIVEVPAIVDGRSEEDLLQDASEHLSTWRTHDDTGRFRAQVQFASVTRGVSELAQKAGADTGAISADAGDL